ncbi:MAG: DUF2169 domain-containing protein [Planctomycetota bacterium]
MTPTPKKPGGHSLLPGQTPEGKFIMAVLLKRSYAIVPSGVCVRAENDKPLFGGDKHFGDPLNTTVRYEADFIPYKLATDVVLNGTAFAPQGKQVREMTASLQIGQVKKEVKIIGDRQCKYRAAADPVFGDPAPFTQMELRYERAFGGVDVYTHPLCQYIYPRNHLGKGFALTNTKATIEGLELPNIEDPNDLLTPARMCVGKIENWPKLPVPTGFGWYVKYWHPRAGWAGLLPADKPTEAMLRAEFGKLLTPEHKALYDAHPLPTVDFRFFNGASPGLAVPYLSGDETVRLTNLTPDGSLVFQLPGDRPAITLDLGDGPKEVKVEMHTVQIRTGENEIDLVWRAAFPYPGPDWLPEMKKADVTVNG